MPITRPLFRISLLLCLLCLLCASIAQAASGPKVVASISPLQALVADVMQGVTEPGLLLDSTQSPHHASLRPSQMRSLSQAELVFWIGPPLESFLPRVLRSLGTNTKTVAMLDTPQLLSLPLRQAHDHDQDRAKPARATAIDPHIWLSTYNAGIMVAEIAARLIELDPAHATIYQRNSQRMQQEMAALHTQISSQFTNRSNYISYHDGYQYFEQEFGLQHAASVSQNDELQPGAGHIRELRQLIQQQGIRCLVYDAPLRPALIDTLLQDSQAQAVELDALGLRQPREQRSWFELVRKLARDFSHCLSAQTKEN